MKTITIKVNIEEIDLEHMLESVSDATFAADNVTFQEHNLIIDIIQKLIRNENKI